MQVSMLTIIPLIAPLALLMYAALLWQRPSATSKVYNIRGEVFGLLGLLVSLVSAGIVFFNGTLQSFLIGYGGLGFAIRMDALSMSMLVMIAILGFVILRFSANYLDGEPRKSVFFSRLAVTIASVQLLILSGNLFQIFFFWVITSICLHSLLIFYRNRPQAVAAARKKYIVARVGDASLMIAMMLIYKSMGSGDLQVIFDAIASSSFEMDVWLSWAAGLLVVTAALKSAQFPTHGWLIEVVETPTPVSALLHAGLLNAGPFLMVRMSNLMIESTTASMLLIVIGGLTALIASVVYMTQPSVKVALGYSSVGHMGFSLLVCGLGVYTAAFLHVVAHSFYKAHAFLSSGSVVDRVRARKFATPKRKGGVLSIPLSIFMALGMYVLFCYLWDIHPERHFNLMALGLIIVMGLSQLLAGAIDTKGTAKAMILAIGLSMVVSTCFFTLEHVSRMLLETQIPQLQQPGSLIQWTIVGVLICYAGVIGLQLFAPRWGDSSFGHRLGVHLRNGLYANVLFDRVIGSLKNEKFKWANLTVQEEDSMDEPGYSKNTRTSAPEILLNN